MPDHAGLRRIRRAAAAADIRAARRRIADIRVMLSEDGVAPGAKAFLMDQIDHEQRRIERLRANAQAASAPPSDLSLRDQFEVDGTFDRLVAQFRDDRKQVERFAQIAAALDQPPHGTH